MRREAVGEGDGGPARRHGQEQITLITEDESMGDTVLHVLLIAYHRPSTIDTDFYDSASAATLWHCSDY